jgi:hypothetical protein
MLDFPLLLAHPASRPSLSGPSIPFTAAPRPRIVDENYRRRQGEMTPRDAYLPPLRSAVGNPFALKCHLLGYSKSLPTTLAGIVGRPL